MPRFQLEPIPGPCLSCSTPRLLLSPECVGDPMRVECDLVNSGTEELHCEVLPPAEAGGNGRQVAVVLRSGEIRHLSFDVETENLTVGKWDCVFRLNSTCMLADLTEIKVTVDLKQAQPKRLMATVRGAERTPGQLSPAPRGKSSRQEIEIRREDGGALKQPEIQQAPKWMKVTMNSIDNHCLLLTIEATRPQDSRKLVGDLVVKDRARHVEDLVISTVFEELPRPEPQWVDPPARDGKMSSLFFGIALPGQSVQKTAALRNAGKAPMRIQNDYGVRPDYPHLRVKIKPLTLAPGETANIDFHWEIPVNGSTPWTLPEGTGTYEFRLSFDDSGERRSTGLSLEGIVRSQAMPAPARKRMIAALVDLSVLACFALGYLAIIWLSGGDAVAGTYRFSLAWTYSWLAIFPWVVGCVLWTSHCGQTFGKFVQGLEIRCVRNWAPPGVLRSLWRLLLTCLLPFPLSSDGRSLHDRLSGTCVIERADHA